MSNGNGKLEQQWLLRRNTLRTARFVNSKEFRVFVFRQSSYETRFIVTGAFRSTLFVIVFQGSSLVIDFFGQ